MKASDPRKLDRIVAEARRAYEPVANKVVSTCVACHGFHLPGHPPMGARLMTSEAKP